MQITNKTIHRFWKHVDKESATPCWLWIGAGHKSKQKYGVFSFNVKPIGAHRFSFMLHFGEIPLGLGVCHTCDNHICVNPEHLFLGTQDDNMKDMVKKGRSSHSARTPGEQSGNHKLTWKMVREIRDKYIPYEYPLSVLAREYSVAKQTIWHIIKNITWRGEVIA